MNAIDNPRVILRQAKGGVSTEFALMRLFLEWQGANVETREVSRLVGRFHEAVILSSHDGVDRKVVVHGFWQLLEYWRKEGHQQI